MKLDLPPVEDGDEGRSYRSFCYRKHGDEYVMRIGPKNYCGTEDYIKSVIDNIYDAPKDEA